MKISILATAIVALGRPSSAHTGGQRGLRGVSSTEKDAEAAATALANVNDLQDAVAALANSDLPMPSKITALLADSDNLEDVVPEGWKWKDVVAAGDSGADLEDFDAWPLPLEAKAMIEDSGLDEPAPAEWKAKWGKWSYWHNLFKEWLHKYHPTTPCVCKDLAPAPDAPTDAATGAPTDAATDAPTDAATDAPTDAATDAPTDAATDAPTDAATVAPPMTEASDPATEAPPCHCDNQH